MPARIYSFSTRSGRPFAMSLRSQLIAVAGIAMFLVLLREPIAAMLDNWQWDRFTVGFYGGFWWAGLFDSNWRWVSSIRSGSAATGALLGGVAAMSVFIVAVVLPGFLVFGRKKRRSPHTGKENGKKEGGTKGCGRDRNRDSGA